MSSNILKNRITFALDAAQEMYDELHDKFMEWRVHDEPFPPECNYMQDLRCLIESLEKALGEIDD